MVQYPALAMDIQSKVSGQLLGSFWRCGGCFSSGGVRVGVSCTLGCINQPLLPCACRHVWPFQPMLQDGKPEVGGHVRTPASHLPSCESSSCECRLASQVRTSGAGLIIGCATAPTTRRPGLVTVQLVGACRPELTLGPVSQSGV